MFQHVYEITYGDWSRGLKRGVGYKTTASSLGWAILKELGLPVQPDLGDKGHWQNRKERKRGAV